MIWHPKDWTARTYLSTAFFLIFVIVFSPKGLVDWALLFQEAERISAQKESLKKEVENLREDLRFYKSSPVAKERALRENLGYLQKDEISLEIIAR